MNLARGGILVDTSDASVCHSSVRIHADILLLLVERIAESLTLEILEERESADYLEIFESFISSYA